MTTKPTYEEVVAFAERVFIEDSYSPSEYQGFMMGVKWLSDNMGLAIEGDWNSYWIERLKENGKETTA